MTHTAGNDALSLERAWVIECSRCANEATSFESQMHEARADFGEAGWTADEDDFQFCPACSGHNPRVIPSGEGNP